MLLIDVNDTCVFGGFTLGQTDTYGVECYLLGVDGWGAPASTAQAVQRVAADGAFATPAFFTARTFTVSGGLVASDRPSLIAAFDRLQAAASIQPQTVTITTGGAVRSVTAQRQGEITISAQTDVYIEFAVTFLAPDPRKLGAPTVVSTFLPSAVGGWTFPFTFPLTISSVVNPGTCSATSPGSLIGPVVLRIDGPVSGPVVTHVASGAQLVLASSYTLAAGAWLTIDMDAHTILENDQADRTSFLTVRGWSGYEPGANVWAYAAQTYNPSTKLTVTVWPAWP